jgi:large conductance mechanosensitive channel
MATAKKTTATKKREVTKTAAVETASKKVTTKKAATKATLEAENKKLAAKLERLKVIRTQGVGDDRELVVSLPEVRVPKFLHGFIDFVRTQGVVGLAVGLVLGVAGKGVVDSLVANIFNPIIGLIGGGAGSIEGRFICLKQVTTMVDGQQIASCTNKLGWGSVLSQLISFVIVAGVVYFIVKGLKLDKLDKPKA